VVYDQSELVGSALGGVARAVAVGASFVVLVIFGLLGDVRAACLVTLTIPLSLALAAIGLDLAGIGINTMTLGGLAIAVGLLVDASIIVCENVVHRLSEHPDRHRASTAAAAAAEVGRPIVFATIIVVAVFLPLFAMGGIEGRMYRPLAAAVIAAMTGSLLLALTFTPVASGLLLRGRPGPSSDTAAVAAVKRAYAPLLDLSLRFPAVVLVVSAALVAPTLVCAGLVGRDFMPELDEGALLVQTFLPPEASLETVDRLNHRVEDELRQVPEVVEVVRRTGRAERTEDPMPHTVSDVLVLLDPDRARPPDEVEDEVRERLGHVLGVGSAVTTPLGMRIDEGLGGTPADLSVRIFGSDLDELARLAAEVERRLSAVPGVADLRAEQLTGLPQVRVEVDRAAAARVGLTPGDVVDALRVGLVGETVSEIRVGQRRYDLVVKLRPDRRSTAEGIRALLIDGHDGTRIPLEKLARIESTTGPGALKREAGSRRVAVEMGVVGRDLGSTADDVRAALADLELPTGTFWDVGGRVESQARASEALARAMGLALVAVLVLLYLALDSVLETAVILATLPLALVGGVLGLVLFGETWNVSSMVGLIGLFGIAVQNGLVLVTQIRGLRAEGLDLDAAVREASLGRVRPKLMTAGTAILGLMPMVVLDLHGTEIERPLAVVMVCGLVSSTAFTLLALPAFYRVAVGASESSVRRAEA
jgi:cobalt-zinc-cadmium resistance protein CzcA